MTDNKMRVLVLGGTGAMGMSLVNILADKGMDVYVTSRKQHISKNENIAYIQGDAKDVNFIYELMKKDWDCIVDFMSYNTDEFRNRADILLTAADQYIFISSARVYAESDGPITEDSKRLLDVCTDKEYLSTDEYALSKARQEDIIITKNSRKYTIVRPSLTYNYNRLQFAISEKEEWLYRALHGRSVVFPKDMVNVKTTMGFGGDVANAIAELIGNPKALGQTVHITGKTSNTWGEILDIYQGVFCEKTGASMKVFMADDSLKIAHDLGRTYQIKYARRINRTFDLRKLESIIGNVPFLSAEEGLSKCLGEFLDGSREFNAINTKTNAYFDRLTVYGIIKLTQMVPKIDAAKSELSLL